MLIHLNTGPEREWWPSVRCTYWVQWHLHRQLREVSGFIVSKKRHVTRYRSSDALAGVHHNNYINTYILMSTHVYVFKLAGV